jgi:hypothetical protein
LPPVLSVYFFIALGVHGNILFLLNKLPHFNRPPPQHQPDRTRCVSAQQQLAQPATMQQPTCSRVSTAAPCGSIPLTRSSGPPQPPPPAGFADSPFPTLPTKCPNNVLAPASLNFLLASLAEESLDEQGERKMELRDLHEEERIKLTDI